MNHAGSGETLSAPAPIQSERRKLYIDVQFGLTNRLRAFSSAIAFARASNRELVLIWVADLHCEARFGDLLANDVALLETEKARVDARSFASKRYNYLVYDGGQRERIDHELEGDIYVRSAYALKSSLSGNSDQIRALRTLRPWQPVLDLAAKIDVRDCIGIHVRRGGGTGFDAAPWDSPAFMSAKEKNKINLWRANSGPERFFPTIDRILRDRPAQKFFLASDEAAVYRIFADRYGGSILHLPRTRYDRSVEQLQFAFADLLLLSRTKQLLGSPNSSFSAAAADLGRVPTLYAGIDF